MEQLQRGSEREVHLRDYLRVTLRRRWTVIACFVVVVVTVTVGTFATEPVYRATCQVLIERETPEMVKIEVGKMKISHCIECRKCEEKGYCVIDDDMQKIYPLLRRSDLVVLASPIFFYGLTGMVKAVVDRAQAK